MKDPRLGTFGALALGAVVLLKTLALAELVARHDPVRLLGAVMLAAALGRWLVILAVRTQPLARPGGMGEAFAKALRPFELFAGVVPVIALTVWMGAPGAVAWIVGLIIFLWLTYLARLRLRGMTGDVFGALVEVAEVAVLLVFCARLP